MGKSKERIVILGAGAAGLSAEDTIRSINPDAYIIVVSGERGLPYARMALPYYINGKISVQDLLTRTKADLVGQRTTYILGDPAAGLDIRRQEVLLESGRVLKYDKLLIATGSIPERPDGVSMDIPGVYHLWTLSDALKIKRWAKRAGTVVIWGAGMVAFVAAKALAAPGRDVYLLCRANRIFRRVLDEEAATLMEQALARKGVKCLKEINVAEVIQWEKDQKRIILNDGRELVADLLIIALGTKPNLSFLEETPLGGMRGIEVDECLETKIPGIYAAGDVAVVSDCVTGEKIAPALWTTAVIEGRAAGLNMVGYRYRCERALVMNVMDLEGYTAVSLGCPLASGDVEIYQFIRKAEQEYRRFVFRENRLIGAILVGRCADAGIFPVLIRRRMQLSKSLKQRILQKPWDVASTFLSLPPLERSMEVEGYDFI